MDWHLGISIWPWWREKTFPDPNCPETRHIHLVWWEENAWAGGVDCPTWGQHGSCKNQKGDTIWRSGERLQRGWMEGLAGPYWNQLLCAVVSLAEKQQIWWQNAKKQQRKLVTGYGWKEMMRHGLKISKWPHISKGGRCAKQPWEVGPETVRILSWWSFADPHVGASYWQALSRRCLPYNLRQCVHQIWPIVAVLHWTDAPEVAVMPAIKHKIRSFVHNVMVILPKI